MPKRKSTTLRHDAAKMADCSNAAKKAVYVKPSASTMSVSMNVSTLPLNETVDPALSNASSVKQEVCTLETVASTLESFMLRMRQDEQERDERFEKRLLMFWNSMYEIPSEQLSRDELCREVNDSSTYIGKKSTSSTSDQPTEAADQGSSQSRCVKQVCSIEDVKSITEEFVLRIQKEAQEREEQYERSLSEFFGSMYEMPSEQRARSEINRDVNAVSMNNDQTCFGSGSHSTYLNRFDLDSQFTSSSSSVCFDGVGQSKPSSVCFDGVGQSKPSSVCFDGVGLSIPKSTQSKSVESMITNASMVPLQMSPFDQISVSPTVSGRQQVLEESVTIASPSYQEVQPSKPQEVVNQNAAKYENSKSLEVANKNTEKYQNSSGRRKILSTRQRRQGCKPPRKVSLPYPGRRSYTQKCMAQRRKASNYMSHVGRRLCVLKPAAQRWKTSKSVSHLNRRLCTHRYTAQRIKASDSGSHFTDDLIQDDSHSSQPRPRPQHVNCPQDVIRLRLRDAIT